MSRWIVEFELEALDEEEEGRVWDVLTEEGAHIDAAFGFDEKTIFEGVITLDVTPDLAHERIQAALRRTVISRWLGPTEEREWDFTIGSDES